MSIQAKLEYESLLEPGYERDIRRMDFTAFGRRAGGEGRRGGIKHTKITVDSRYLDLLISNNRLSRSKSLVPA